MGNKWMFVFCCRQCSDPIQQGEYLHSPGLEGCINALLIYIISMYSDRETNLHILRNQTSPIMGNLTLVIWPHFIRWLEKTPLGKYSRWLKYQYTFANF